VSSRHYFVRNLGPILKKRRHSFTSYDASCDLNPDETKDIPEAIDQSEDAPVGENGDAQIEKLPENTETEIEEDDIDEAEFLEAGGGRLVVTVENPEKTQVYRGVFYKGPNFCTKFDPLNDFFASYNLKT